MPTLISLPLRLLPQSNCARGLAFCARGAAAAPNCVSMHTMVPMMESQSARGVIASVLLLSACSPSQLEDPCDGECAASGAETSGGSGADGPAYVAGTTSNPHDDGQAGSFGAAGMTTANDTAGTGGALGDGATGGPSGAGTDAGGADAGGAGAGGADAGGADAGGADAGGNTTAVTEGDEPSSARMTMRPVGTTEAGLGYWEYLPSDYDAEPKPLLVFTHGASWQGEGSDVTLPRLLEVGPPALIAADAWPNERPFIVLSPQNPRAGCFDPGDIDAFYRYALERYEVDPSRIYHTGQSCGAIGAWNYLAAHGDEFVAAAVLISGDGRDAFEQAGCELGRVPIWGLHNENDRSVSSQGTIAPIEALMQCEPAADVKLTIYPGATEHDAWTKTYDLSAGNDVFAWLLEHRHE